MSSARGSPVEPANLDEEPSRRATQLTSHPPPSLAAPTAQSGAGRARLLFRPLGCGPLSEAVTTLDAVTRNQERLRVVGNGGAEALARAARHLGQFTESADSPDQVLASLDSAIDSTRSALEECLDGHDSFDALAFLRMSVSPWDFSATQESQTRLEKSQAAQDVVALTMLGMGLPRFPLTGENTGQPDIGKAMNLAAQFLKRPRRAPRYGVTLCQIPLALSLASSWLTRSRCEDASTTRSRPS